MSYRKRVQISLFLANATSFLCIIWNIASEINIHKSQIIGFGSIAKMLWH